MQAYNDVTVQVDWPKGTFGPAVVDGPERGTWPVRLMALGLSLVGVVVVAVAALGRRRLLWSRTRQGVVATFGGAPDATPSELVPSSPRVDAPIEFVPPMNLRPAELLRLEKGAAADPARLIAVHRDRPRRVRESSSWWRPRTTTTGSPATARAAPAGSCAATRTGCSSPCSRRVSPRCASVTAPTP